MTVVDQRKQRLAAFIRHVWNDGDTGASHDAHNPTQLGAPAWTSRHRRTRSTVGRCALSWRRHALRRVIANLLDNACKYGNGRVHLSVWQEEQAVLLAVEDDGPGIPPDQRAAEHHRFREW